MLDNTRYHENYDCISDAITCVVEIRDYDKQAILDKIDDLIDTLQRLGLNI